MRLAISNLAWKEIESQSEIEKILRKFKIEELEIIASKDNYQELIKDRKIASMQSILYDCDDNIFESKESQRKVKRRLKETISVAKILDCNHLVFGCPKNRRLIESKSNAYQYSQAINFFREIADTNRTIVFGIEPVSRRYDCNFLNDFKKTLSFVKKINRKNIRVNLDLANLTDSNTLIEQIFKDLKYVSHIHISETDLSEIRCSENLRRLIEFVNLDKDLSERLVFSIEAKDLSLTQIERSLKVIQKYLKDVG